MSPNDLQPHQQEADSNSTLRQRLLSEIAGTCPPPRTRPQPTVAEAEDIEWGNCHPFRDLNVTELARRLDSIFNRRWFTGLGGKNAPARQACNGPSPSALLP